MLRTIEALVSYYLPIQRPLSRLTKKQSETLLARLEPEERSLVDNVETMVSVHDKLTWSYNWRLSANLLGYGYAVAMLGGAASAMLERGPSPSRLTILGIGAALGLASIYLSLKFVSPIERKAKQLKLYVLSEQASPEYVKCVEKLETLRLLDLPQHKTIAQRLLSPFSHPYR